jgi:beta-glucanase (GH16 family)
MLEGEADVHVATPPTESASIRINDTFNQFHLYTLLWTNSTIQIAIDNYTYFIYNNPNQRYDSWPFNNFFNIILNFSNHFYLHIRCGICK